MGLVSHFVVAAVWWVFGFGAQKNESLRSSLQCLRTSLKINGPGHIVTDGFCSDITDEHITQRLYTHLSPDPDLLIRTSGEIRLSDFLLWQSSHSVLSFLQVLWPEFNLWHLLASVLYYQRHFPYLRPRRRIRNLSVV